jgi:dUTP pyrophosphatase
MKPTNQTSVDLGVIDLNAVQPPVAVSGEVHNTASSGDNIKLRVPVGIYKLSDTAKTPKYGTEGSACFDLHADFTGIESIKVYTPANMEMKRNVQRFREYDGLQGVVIDSGERALIPTNLIFDIPENWKMLIYARSGTSLKQAMGLANSVGVIDHDYVDPTFVIIINQSDERFVIRQDDRIAQAELVPVYQASFNILSEAPKQKTTRAGGFGSTGK